MLAREIRKYYTSEPVLNRVSLELRPGERVSLVGPNGAGKTTLMHILAGKLEPDAGQVEVPAGMRVGYLEQQPKFDPERTVWEEARDAFADVLKLTAESDEVARQIAAAASNGDVDEPQRRRLEAQFDSIQHELQRRNAYEIDHQIERVLGGLGFAKEAYPQRIGSLSGGQQNRLLLAKLLLEAPDIMLLDEPSNHLDIEATEWLENYLVESNQTLMIVSHDRYLLDRVATRTLELLRGELESFPGNYSAYRRQKAERLEVQRRTYEKQQIEIAKMEDFIRRNHYGQKHQQAEDRRKKLERIERVPPPREIGAPPMSFPAASRTGDIVLRVEQLEKSYARPLFRNVTFDVLRGEKWGILGPNGVGKTTLLRCLLGHVTPDGGQVTHGAGVRIGYFDQMLTCLDPETPVVEAIRPTHKEFVEQQRRDLLARFGITGEMVFQKVSSLSGGEKNRVALAKLAASDANVLVLDEPTNHLDLWARDSLERALREFDGTVVFVSHDRYFVNQVADHLLVMDPDRAWVVAGDYDTYRRIRAGVVDEAGGEAAKRGNKGKEKEKERAGRNQRPARERPKRRFPFRKPEELENDIAECEQQIADIHEQMASPDVTRDSARIKSLMAQLEEAQQRLEQLYEHWEEAIGE